MEALLSRPGLALRVAGGRVARLSLKVPWTSLGAQPLVLTLHNVHCTLRGGARREEDAPQGPPQGAQVQAEGAGRKGEADGKGAPSYVQSLLQAMLAGVIVKVGATKGAECGDAATLPLALPRALLQPAQC